MTPQDLFACIQWGAAYRPEWNAAPERYREAGLVQEGKSRRLGKLEEPGRRFRAYLGVQHAVAGPRWGAREYTRFFVSLSHRGRVLILQTHLTLESALAQAWSVYQRLPETETAPPPSPPPHSGWEGARPRTEDAGRPGSSPSPSVTPCPQHWGKGAGG
ncbi:MAG: hypothetical protein NTZ05_04920 [Chloroflexi bacterium]|nr:hypothetical protein [Chloroflexota bacterium]